MHVTRVHARRVFPLQREVQLQLASHYATCMFLQLLDFFSLRFSNNQLQTAPSYEEVLCVMSFFA